MSKEKEKLLGLLNEGKISEKDFKDLSDALDKKSSSVFKLLFNPFQRFAGTSALTLGIIVLVLLSGIGFFAGTEYGGILDLHFSKKHDFLRLLFQNVVSMITLSTVFFAAAYINKQKGLRFVDFLGTAALSRFPYLLSTIFMWAIITYDPSILDFRPGQPIPKGLIIMAFPSLLFVIWQIVTYFFAFKVSSGLLGVKLWVSFIFAILIGEAISVPLTRLLF